MINKGGLKFKHENDAREFFMGRTFIKTSGQGIFVSVDPLLNILVRAYDWLFRYYESKPAIITHVFRSWNVQREIYGGIEKFKEKEWPSVHFYGHGCDMRQSSCEDHNDLMAKALNELIIYDPKRPKKCCAVFHDVGSGGHCHLQTHPNSVLKGIKTRIESED